jgi:tetratricopeptide (TPR) repeat protein
MSSSNLLFGIRLVLLGAAAALGCSFTAFAVDAPAAPVPWRSAARFPNTDVGFGFSISPDAFREPKERRWDRAAAAWRAAEDVATRSRAALAMADVALDFENPLPADVVTLLNEALAKTPADAPDGRCARARILRALGRHTEAFEEVTAWYSKSGPTAAVFGEAVMALARAEVDPWVERQWLEAGDSFFKDGAAEARSRGDAGFFEEWAGWLQGKVCVQYQKKARKAGGTESYTGGVAMNLGAGAEALREAAALAPGSSELRQKLGLAECCARMGKGLSPAYAGALRAKLSQSEKLAPVDVFSALLSTDGPGLASGLRELLATVPADSPVCRHAGYARLCVLEALLDGDLGLFDERVAAYQTEHSCEEDVTGGMVVLQLLVHAGDLHADLKQLMRQHRAPLGEVFRRSAEASDRPAASAKLARFQSTLGDEAESRRVVERMVVRYPDSAWGWTSLAAYQIRDDGDAAGALGSLARAAETLTAKDNDDLRLDYWSNLALARRGAGDLAGARRALVLARAFKADKAFAEVETCFEAGEAPAVVHPDVPWKSVEALLADEFTPAALETAVLGLSDLMGVGDSLVARARIEALAGELPAGCGVNDLRHLLLDLFGLKSRLGELREDSWPSLVLAQRAGNCIGVSTLFAMVARRRGLEADVACLPGHAVVRMAGAGEAEWVEPSGLRSVTPIDYRDSFRSEADWLAFCKGQSATPSEVLLSLLFNEVGARLWKSDPTALDLLSQAARALPEDARPRIQAIDAQLAREEKVDIGASKQPVLRPGRVQVLDDGERVLRRIYREDAPIAELERALRSLPPLHRKPEAEAGLHIQLALAAKDWAEAGRRCEQAAGLDRLRPHVLAVANELCTRGEPAAAEAVWRAVLAHDPSCLEAASRLGVALASRGEAEAQGLLKGVLARLPVDSAAAAALKH